MNDPRPPRRIPAIDGRSVLETALVAVGVTALFGTATLLALVAASTVSDDPSITAAVALLVGTTTIAVGVAGARRLGSRFALDRNGSLAGT